MKESVLALFPAHAHPLVLASDPDGVLREEEILAELVNRGLRIVSETDPLRLRQQVESLRPWTVENPLLVVAAGALNELPYDLWQQGHHVALALHTFFPNLAYPLVKALTPAQRARLARVPQPAQALGRLRTIEYILEHVFEAEMDALARPGHLVAWLGRVHQWGEPLPTVLIEALCERLSSRPAYGDWPLASLLSDRAAFTQFVRSAWERFIAVQEGRPIEEEQKSYHLTFERDVELQRAVPSLLDSGVLRPITVDDPKGFPSWARQATTVSDAETTESRLSATVNALERRLAGADSMRWEDWQEVARLWAEAAILFDACAKPEWAERTRAVQNKLDAAFGCWLRGHYVSLAVDRLPVPHHLHHVPHFMAYRRRQPGQTERVALIVLDGMSLTDWMLINPVWRKRHRKWRMEELLLLAQVPTITEVSRQALVSGRCAKEFQESLCHNRHEPEQWRLFWASEDLPEDAVGYGHLQLDRQAPPEIISSNRLRALCLVDASIDELCHGASLGAAGVLAALKVWLRRYSPKIEKLISDLLRSGYTVYLCSDHGHAEAQGIGIPQEGLLPQARHQRARIYTDRAVARRAQERFPETEIWERDGLLPDEVCVLLPKGRLAFTQYNDTVVTHGGVTMEEVVVPLITITGPKHG